MARGQYSPWGEWRKGLLTRAKESNMQTDDTVFSMCVYSVVYDKFPLSQKLARSFFFF